MKKIALALAALMIASVMLASCDELDQVERIVDKVIEASDAAGAGIVSTTVGTDESGNPIETTAPTENGRPAQTTTNQDSEVNTPSDPNTGEDNVNTPPDNTLDPDVLFRDYDYNGKRIYICATTNTEITEFSNDLSPDQIEQAVYERDCMAETVLNADIKAVLYDEETILTKLRECVSTGSNVEMDIVNISQSKAMIAAQENSLTNLISGESKLNFEREWWSEDYFHEYNIGDQLFTCTGDISPNLYANSYAVFVNIDAFKMVGGAPYDLQTDVESGSWTIENMKTYSSMFAQDLDADGVFDSFALSSSRAGLFAMLYGAEMNMLDEEYKFTLDEQDMSAINHVSSLLNDRAVLCTKTQESADTAFMNGEAAFTINKLSFGYKKLSPAGISFSVLPLPKCAPSNEYQTISQGYTVFAIPIVADTETSSVVLECLGCCSSECNVIWKFSNYSCGEKILANFFDLAFKNICFDISFEIGTTYTGFLNTLITNPGAAPSTLAQKKSVLRSELESFLSATYGA